MSVRKFYIYAGGVLVIIVLLAGCYLTQPVSVSAIDASVSVDPAVLKEHVRVLSVEYAPRDSRHPRNLDRAAAYIKRQFAKYSSRVRLQTFTVNGVAYHNVIAEFGPQAGRRIVVGAHYDAAIGTPGADDNASGVAVLIELAALLAKRKPGMTIELVAYTLEEMPYFRTRSMGSYHHAASLYRSKAAVRLMLSLEMLGFYSEKQGSQKYPLGFLRHLYSDTGNFIAVIGRFGQAGTIRMVKKHLAQNTGIRVYSMTAPASLTGVDFSDHLNYWKFGYPAVMITDTAFYRNPHYHRRSDTWNRLDYRKMAALANGIQRMLLQLAVPD